MAGESSGLTRRFARTVLKPLSAREEAAASRAALAAVATRTSTPAGRLRPFPPELRIEKPDAPGGAPTRLVRVRVHDRDQRLFHDVSVDRAGKVVDHRESDTAGMPLLPDEIEEARRIASSRDDVASLLAQQDVAVEVISAAGHEPGRRAGLRLFRRRRDVEDLGVVDVDLDRDEVVRVALLPTNRGR
jgi:hypothetical protein